MKAHRCLGLLLAAATALPFGALAWPSIPTPPRSQVESAGQNMRVGGVPTRILIVRAPLSEADMLEHYRGYLGERRVERTVNGDKILGQAQGDYFITVRVKRRTGPLTEAIVSASETVKPNARQPSPGVPLPAGSVVLSDVESDDVGKASRHLVFANKASLDANENTLRTWLQERGYTQWREMAATHPQQRAWLLDGNRREGSLVLFSRNGATHAVLTTVHAHEIR